LQYIKKLQLSKLFELMITYNDVYIVRYGSYNM